MHVREVMETCLYAADLESAERFYSGVLGLPAIGREAGRHVFFRCGRGVLLIFSPIKAAEEGHDVPPHGSTGPGHIAFAVPEEELPLWRSRLEQAGVSIERDFEWPWGGRSIYFRDPAGNSLEVTTPRIWSITEDEFFRS
jgi:catechol 2,3-dioxygenase-like lactoylglutathione lyase family enzyme